LKVSNLQSLDYKQLRSLQVVHNHLLDFFFFIARAKKLSVRFSFTIQDEHGSQDVEYYTLSTIGYPEEIPHEFQKFLDDYSTRLIAERNFIEAALEDLQESLLLNSNR
jgi:hypothetical protein